MKQDEKKNKLDENETAGNEFQSCQLSIPTNGKVSDSQLAIFIPELLC